MDSCDILASGRLSSMLERMYLESATQAENAVVGLLGAEALERSVDDVVLLGEQVIGPVRQSVSSDPGPSPPPSLFPVQTPNASRVSSNSPFCSLIQRFEGLQRTSGRAACSRRR